MDLPLANVTVFMTPQEAALFIEFQKRRKVFEALESADAFSIKGGSCTIHFDNNGNVGSLDINRRYKIIS